MTRGEQGIERIEFAGRPAWRKHYSGTRRRVLLALLRRLARWLGANALMPPLPRSAQAACATERRLLERLRAQGAIVPDVLSADARSLVLADLGPTLAAACRGEADPARRAELVAAGFAALERLHACAGCLSQAFARNMVLSKRGVGFIDLEEDPLEVMSLEAAQARDLLLYVYSTARFLADQPDRYQALLDVQLARAPEAVRAQVRRVAQGLRWLEPLARRSGRRASDAALGLRMLLRASLVLLIVLGVGEVVDAAWLLADYALDGLL